MAIHLCGVKLMGIHPERMSSADSAPIHDQTLEMNSVPPRNLTGVAVGPTVAGVMPLAVAEVASSADLEVDPLIAVEMSSSTDLRGPAGSSGAYTSQSDSDCEGQVEIVTVPGSVVVFGCDGSDCSTSSYTVGYE